MKKIFGVLLMTILSFNIFAQNDVNEYLDILVKNNSILYKNLHALKPAERKAKQVELNSLVEKIQKDDKILSDDIIMSPIYRLQGFNTLEEFNNYALKMNNFAIINKEKLSSPEILKLLEVKFHDETKNFQFLQFLEDRCGRCQSTYEAAMAGLSAAYFLGNIGCAALTFPPFVLACAAANLVVYVSGSGVASNTRDDCKDDHCPKTVVSTISAD